MTSTPRPMLGIALTLALAASAACGRPTPSVSDGRTAVWLDVSPALGDPPRDPADALAVLQAFGSDRLHVRGVSTTFGNVPLVRGFPAAQALLERLDSRRLRPWRGASSPEERQAPTEASELLTEALDEAPLTIVAAGPVTTMAATLLRRPDLASRIERIVLIGGQPADAPPAPDPQVAADPGSLEVILRHEIAVTLVPAGDRAGLTLNEADLVRLDAGDSLLRLVTTGARGWLAERGRTGAARLDAPALLAVDVVAHPGEARCESATAALAGSGAATRLVVSGTPGAGGRRVTWCHTADAGAHERVLATLLAVRSTP